MITNSPERRASSSGDRIQYGWLPITLILIAAAVIFTYRLGYEGIWIDEFFSIRDATTFQNNFLEGYQNTRLRPLYYMVLAAWMHLGSSDAWLRIPSVVASLFSVFLIYRLGKRLSEKTTGLIAAALLATSPLFVNHTQEIRMYALSLCLGLAGSLFAADILLTPRDQKPNQKSFIGWTVFRLLAIYTVPLNLTLLIPDGILMLLRFRRDRATLISCIKWVCLLLLLWSPTVFIALSEVSPSSEYAQTRGQYLAKPGLSNLVYPLKYWMVGPFVTQGSKVAHVFYKLFTLLVAGLVGAGLIHKRKSPALPWAAAWFVIPLIPIILCSLFAAQLWELRYVLFVSPYLFILMAAGFTRLFKDWKPVAILFIAIYTIGMGKALVHYYNVQNRADYKFNLATIEQAEQKGDAIVWGHRWHPTLGRSALSHYYKGDAEVYFNPSFEVDSPEEIEEWIGQVPADHDRIWLVVEDFKPMKENFETVVSNTFNIEESFTNYERNSAVFLLTPAEKAS